MMSDHLNNDTIRFSIFDWLYLIILFVEFLLFYSRRDNASNQPHNSDESSI